jgi:aqualysin 1
MKKESGFFKIFIIASLVLVLLTPTVFNSGIVRAQAPSATDTPAATLVPDGGAAVNPTAEPTSEPVIQPTDAPVAEPTQSPTEQPAVQPEPTQPPSVVPLLKPGGNMTLPDRYIVVYKSGSSSKAAVSAGVSDVKAMGGEVSQVYTTTLHGFAARLAPDQLDKLRQDKSIDYIEQDQTVSINSAVSGGANEPLTAPYWGLDRIDQLSLPVDGAYHYYYDGSTSYVFVIDTGILATHAQFEGRASMVFDGAGDDLDMDCNGHGTAVASIIGGKEYGVAKKAQLYGVRVLNCSGSGALSNVIAGIDFIPTFVQKYNVPQAVVNMSLGGALSKAEDSAIQTSIASGITYVVAAGNSNDKACNYSPADVPQAITVGATDAGDMRYNQSNYGSCVDLFAPGVGIQSAWIGSNTATASLDGTSMSSAFAAGVAALYLDANPTAKPADVAAALVNNATPNIMKTSPIIIGKGSPNRLLYSLNAPPVPKLIIPSNGGTLHPFSPMIWSAVSDVVNYDLQISKTPKFTLPIFREDVTPTTTLPYPGDSLTDGIWYWRIKAINAAGVSSSWSAVNSFTYSSILTPKPVLNKPVEGATVAGTPVFSWAKVKGAVNYGLFICNDINCNTTYAGPFWPTATSYTPAIAIAPGTYYWVVSAYDKSGMGSGLSLGRKLIVTLPGPATPVLTLPANKQTFFTASLVTFKWNAANYANLYHIQFSTDSKFKTIYIENTVPNPTYTVGPFTTGGTYYWHVYAINGQFNNVVSPYSKVYSFTVFDPAFPIPSTPANLATVVGNPTFTWKKVPGATVYRVLYSLDSSPSDNCLTHVTYSPLLPGTSFTPSPVLDVGTYSWCLASADYISHSSDLGPSLKFTITPPTPPVPTLTLPTNGAKTNNYPPVLNCTALPYGARYQFQISNSSKFTTLEQDSSPNSQYITTPYYSPAPLAFGTWYWRVRAVNTLGVLSPKWSEVRSFTLYNTFNSNFVNDSDGWASMGKAWTHDLNNLLTTGQDILNQQTTTAYYPSALDPFGDFTYSARMRMDLNSLNSPDATTVNNVYGLVVRGTPTPDNNGHNNWLNGIYFEIGQKKAYDNAHNVVSKGCYQVNNIVNGVWTTLTSGGWNNCPNNINVGDWNELKVTAVGTTVNFSINGNLVWVGTNIKAPLSGQQGVITWRPSLVAETTYVDWARSDPPEAVVTSLPASPNQTMQFVK